MTTSPQFRQAILSNMERLNALTVSVERHATLGMQLEDYAKRTYLRKRKPSNILASFFLQKVF